MSENFDEKKIILSAQAGDAQAETTLILRYKYLTKSLSRSFFLVGGDKDDLLQIGTIGLLRAIRNYDTNSATSFKTFATACIRNSMLDAIRKWQPTTSSLDTQNVDDDNPLLPHIDNPETTYIQNETAILLLGAIATRLTPVEFEVLKLYLDAMSYEEIGKRLGLEKKKVDNTIYSLKKKIKKLLNEAH